MNNPIEKDTFEVPCPKCGKEIQKTYAWLKDNQDMPFECPDCGEDIAIDSRQLEKETARIDNSLSEVSKKSNPNP